jgi:hypothetical protein
MLPPMLLCFYLEPSPHHSERFGVLDGLFPRLGFRHTFGVNHVLTIVGDDDPSSLGRRYGTH